MVSKGRINTGDYFLLDLSNLGITDKVDVAVGQCLNKHYYKSNARNREYVFSVDYICLGRKYKETFYIPIQDTHLKEHNPIIKKISEQEYLSTLRSIKLRTILD